MNELKTDINGKFPFFLDDIRFLDNAYRMAFEAFAKAVSFNENVILYGINVTDNGENSFTFSQGAVVLNGDILEVAERTLNVTPGNKAIITKDKSWDNAGFKLFGDGTQHNTYKVIKGVISVTGEGETGGFVDIAIARRISDIQDFDGLIYKGLLTSDHDLSNLDKPGLYTIKGNSLPGNFPSADTIKLVNEQISQSSSFYLKIVYLGEGKTFQELGFKRGMLARRYKSSGGWGLWLSFWAKPTDVLEGIRKCAVISPYTLQKHENWQTPTYLGNFNSGVGLIKEIYYRKLTDGRVEVRGEAKCEIHHTDTDVIQLPEGYRPDVALKYVITCASTGGTDTITIGIDGKFIFSTAHYQAYINIPAFSIN